MSKKTTLFSNDTWRELKKRLNYLGALCCPPTETIRPKIHCKYPSDFGFDDVLKWGRSAMPIEPSELKNIWENKQTLKEHDIDYIIVNGNKWFYNTHDKIGNFFLSDGTTKVEMEFPYWMEMTNVLKTKGIRSAIFDTLNLYSNGQEPTAEQMQNCFSDELCQEIYRKNPCREAIELGVLEITEVFRKSIVEHLIQNHEADIAKEISYKRYVKSFMSSKTSTTAPKVRQFLAAKKSAIYILAEKFGLIKNSHRICRYESMRDHVRHPDEIAERPIDPYKIYADFCIALDEPVKSKTQARHLSRLGNNIALSIYLSTFNFIQTILAEYEDSSLKKKKNKTDYYNDLVQKGILKPKEVKLITSRSLNCAEVAHLHNKIKNARFKVMNDRQMFNLACAIHKRHLEIQK